MTKEIFRDDSYQKSCEATVTGVNDRGGVLLDCTVFYPAGGGQPGDKGVLRLASGETVEIVTTVKGDGAEDIVHVPAEGAPSVAAGDVVTAEIDWELRYAYMRMHTCL
ncbi:MAG: alanine--tRNA ligase-related protein, partial [Alphaproteobacteria bacterium]